MTRIKIFILFLCFIFFTSCRNTKYTDPFWDIELYADKTSIINFLNEKTKTGEFDFNIFSYHRIYFVKNRKFDARINGILNCPVYINNKLDRLSYTLTIGFKDEEIPEFNKDFYDFFLLKMKNTFGKPLEQSVTDSEYKLKWVLKGSELITVNVFRNINEYKVVVQN